MYKKWIALVVFCATVFAQDQVLVLPSPMQVVYAGGPATFECLSSFVQRSTARIEWLINGSLLVNLSLNNVTTALLRGGNNQIRGGTLRFSAVPVEYNMTTVQCHAVFTTGDPITSSMTVLFVQGLLDAADLMVFSDNSTIFLNWMAPFTLLGASEITYCMDIVSPLNTKLLRSDCGINITEFTFRIPCDIVCGVLSFTVTPVNVVGNGTTSTVSQNITTVPDVTAVHSMSSEILIVMTAPVCNVILTFVDVDTGETIRLRDSDVTITETNITFSIHKLRENRHYNVTIAASNTTGPVTSLNGSAFPFITNSESKSNDIHERISAAVLSTHDIRNVTLNENAVIFAEVDYVTNSTATGAFLAFVSYVDGLNSNIVYLSLDRSTFRSHTLPFSLSAGKYRVFAYDIESDGTLASGVGYPAVSTELVVTQTTQGLSYSSSYAHLKSCQVNTLLSLIAVTCVYPSDSIATGFQVIVSSQTNQLHFSKTTDRHTPVSVVVEEDGLYQVTIFPIRGERGIVGSYAEYTEMVTIDDVVPTIPPDVTASVPTSPQNTSAIFVISIQSFLSPDFDIQNYPGIGGALAIFVLISIAQCAIILILCHHRLRGKKEVQLGQLATLDAGAQNLQLYEEIKDSEAGTSTTGITGGNISSRDVATAVSQYEDVSLPAGAVAKSDNSYTLTQCPAYGVSSAPT